MNSNINTLLNSLGKIREIRKADKNIGEYSSTSDNTMVVGTRRRIYHYFPTSKQELIEIIVKKIYNEGNINYKCNLNDIDVSGVGDDLSYLFKWTTYRNVNYPIDMRNFNGHIENWDVSNVETMHEMFVFCSSFNQDLSKWDVSNVKDMYGMFCACSNFDQNISKWDVSNVEDMYGMFGECSNFDQDISNWDVHNVENMYGMFDECSKFNQNLSNWDVHNVKDMGRMFCGCSEFDQDISNWDVSNVEEYYKIFDGCPIKEEYKPYKFRMK